MNLQILRNNGVNLFHIILGHFPNKVIMQQIQNKQTSGCVFCMASGRPMGLLSEENQGCKKFAWIQIQISCALGEDIHEAKPLGNTQQL